MKHTKLLIGIIVGLAVGLAWTVSAVNITVPSAPATNYYLQSTSTGAYLAVSSSTIRNGLGIGTIASFASTDYLASSTLSTITAGYIPLSTSTSALVNSAIFQLGGNIGIGTTSPNYKLDVNGSIRQTSSTSAYAAFDSNGQLVATTTPLLFYNVSSANSFISVATTTTSATLTFSTSTLYSSFSASSPITYNTSTGAFGWNNSTNYITSSTANGLYLQIANNLSDLTNTSTARTNLGLGSSATQPSTDYLASSTQRVFHWSISNESGVQIDPCIFHFPSASTITAIWAGNKINGESVTFNLGYSTGVAANSTSTVSRLFTSNQAVTSTSTPGSSLTINGSSTPAANTCLTYWTSAASSTEFWINGVFTTP